MKWLIGLTVFTVLLAIYVTVARPMMRKTVAGAKFLDAIEPIERALWLKSETILWSRFKFLLGTVLTIITTTNLDVFTPLIPEQYKPLIAALPTIALALDGMIGEWLRRDTTKPVEIVAMRTDAPEAVKAAAADADAVNKEVVAEVKASEAIA